jgi:cytochrome c-type biogenesis protein CcmH
VAAAQQLTPDQRSEMIRGMVDRLAEKLKADGSDLDGWLRLMRAYIVLGEPDKARTALADARKAMASDADKRKALDDFAKGLGIEG